MGLYVVRVDGVKFDHHSSTCLIKLQKKSSKNSHWKMNMKYFDEVNDSICMMQKSVPQGAPFFSKLKQIIKYYKEHYKCRTFNFQCSKESLRHKFEKVQGKFQGALHDPLLQSKVGKLRSRLESIKVVGGKNRTCVKWKEKGML